MSPEQARGKPSTNVPTSGVWLRALRDADRTTRVRGRHRHGHARAVLQRDPDLGGHCPRHACRVAAVVDRRCLDKDRRARLHTSPRRAFQIDEVLAGASPAASAAPARAPSSVSPRVTVPAIIASAIGGAAMAWLILSRAPAATLPVTRLQVGVAPADELGGSRGRRSDRVRDFSRWQVAGVFGSAEESAELVSSPTRSGSGHADSRHRGALNPFFSPDGQWIG